MGLAVSDDGIHFEKHKANPIYDCFTRGTWEDHGTPQSQSILKDNGVYWMYYQIKEPVEIISHENGRQTFLGDRCRAALAFSTDLHHWRECPRFAGYDNKCILDVGPPGSIDDLQASPDWMIRRGNTFHLFYHAINGIRVILTSFGIGAGSQKLLFLFVFILTLISGVVFAIRMF